MPFSFDPREHNAAMKQHETICSEKKRQKRTQKRQRHKENRKEKRQAEDAGWAAFLEQVQAGALSQQWDDIPPRVPASATHFGTNMWTCLASGVCCPRHSYQIQARMPRRRSGNGLYQWQTQLQQRVRLGCAGTALLRMRILQRSIAGGTPMKISRE